jgi:hypothetical protein
LKPAQVNSSREPISEKKKSQEGARRVAHGAGPELKPQYWKKEKCQAGYARRYQGICQLSYNNSFWGNYLL